MIVVRFLQDAWYRDGLDYDDTNLKSVCARTVVHTFYYCTALFRVCYTFYVHNFYHHGLYALNLMHVRTINPVVLLRSHWNSMDIHH